MARELSRFLSLRLVISKRDIPKIMESDLIIHVMLKSKLANFKFTLDFIRHKHDKQVSLFKL